MTLVHIHVYRALSTICGLNQDQVAAFIEWNPGTPTPVVTCETCTRGATTTIATEPESKQPSGPTIRRLLNTLAAAVKDLDRGNLKMTRARIIASIQALEREEKE